MQTHIVNGQEFTHLELQEKYNIPNNVEVVGVNLVATDAEDFIKREKCFEVWRCFPIDGIAYQTYCKIYDYVFAEYNFHPLDIFDQTVVSEKILLQCVGPSATKKFLEGIESYRNGSIPMESVIRMLAIDGCGTSTRTEFSHYLAGNEHDFSGKTKVIIEQLKNSSEDIEYLREHLQRYGNITIELPKPRVEQVLTESTVTYVMTGSPKACGYEGTKAVFKASLPSNWIEVKKLTTETTYLVAGDANSTSSKAKTARKNGTKVITYVDAVNMINA